MRFGLVPTRHQCCESASFWCGSGSGLPSTCGYYPKFYTCWKIGQTFFTFVHSNASYTVFFFANHSKRLWELEIFRKFFKMLRLPWSGSAKENLLPAAPPSAKSLDLDLLQPNTYPNYRHPWRPLCGCRCRDYNPPEFTLDIQCLADNHKFLMDLVTELGIRYEGESFPQVYLPYLPFEEISYLWDLL